MSIKNIVATCLVLIVIGTLGYNFKVGYEQRYDAFGDAREYIALGTSITKTGSYGLLDISNADLLKEFEKGAVGNKDFNFKRYATWRPPIWPHLIAGVFLVTGYSLTAILVFKMLLFLLGGYLFYKTLSLLHFSNWIVVLGTFLYLVHPTSQMYSRFFLSEPITLFFVTLFLFVAVRFIKGHGTSWLLGLVGGIVVLCHPYFVFLPFTIYGFFFLYKKCSFKQLIICGLIAAGVVSLWVIRNAVVLDTDKLVFTTSSGAVMAKGWNSQVISSHTNTKGDLADEALVLENYPYDTTVMRDEVAQSSLYTAAVMHFIKSNPDQILPIIFTKLRSAFNPMAETSKPGFLETGRVLFHFLALIALVYALFLSKSKTARIVALSLLLATVGITIITYSGFRFRMPQLVLELFLIVVMAQELVARIAINERKNVL